MSAKVSVVINTFNEEENIERALKSVGWADEVVVCDMHSEDKTVEIAKKHGARVVYHERTGFVEPARNFAISRAKNSWVLVLDADEEIPGTLADKLKEIATDNSVTTFVHIPRKNMIFGKWVKASMWWPDQHIRFFKKEHMDWPKQIHGKPNPTGQGVSLPVEERWAIIHHHYTSISQYIERNSRYCAIQAKELVETGYQFDWKDLIRKPLNEFLSRYFAHRGFEDGLHGLILSLLQAFMFLQLYVRVWELQGFEQKQVDLRELKAQSDSGGKDLHYWFNFSSLSQNPVKRILQKAKNRLS